MKKNVASQIVGAQMVSAADGTAFTGAVTVSVTGDGGVQATGSVGAGACTHEGNGFHSYAPAQAETNYNHIAFTFTGTGAIPVTVQVYPTFPQTVDNATALSDIQARIPASLVSGRIDASVGAMASGALTAAAIAASALNGKGDWNIGKTGYSLTQTFPANFADMSITLTTGLVNITQAAADKVWDTTLSGHLTAGSTGAALNGASAPSAAAVADAVWDEVLSGHLTAGSTGNALNASGSAGDPWATAIPGAYGAGTAGKILGDNINATISSRASQASVDTVDDLLDTEIAAIKADTAAILIDTAEIGVAGAGLTALATQASVNTIDDLLDTEIAAIKAETASIQTDTNDIQTRLPAALVGGRMDSNLSAISNSTTTLAAFNRAVKGNVIGTVGAGSTTTSIVSSSLTPAGSVADQFKGRLLTFADDTTTAALRGQSTDITANTLSATPTFTVTALTTAPASTDTFSIT